MNTLNDVAGWAAAALTLLAFSCNNLLHLRLTALAANAAFIAYGITAQLWPVAALHVVLVPVNLWRLWQVRQVRQVQQVLRQSKAKSAAHTWQQTTRRLRPAPDGAAR
jgi:predicted Abi (CAAX) family protease